MPPIDTGNAMFKQQAETYEAGVRAAGGNVATGNLRGARGGVRALRG